MLDGEFGALDGLETFLRQANEHRTCAACPGRNAGAGWRDHASPTSCRRPGLAKPPRRIAPAPGHGRVRPGAGTDGTAAREPLAGAHGVARPLAGDDRG